MLDTTGRREVIATLSADRMDLLASARPSRMSHATRSRDLGVSGFSTRFKILLWCTLLVAVALTASVVATRIVLLHNLSQETDSELTHELNEIGLGHGP